MVMVSVDGRRMRRLGSIVAIATFCVSCRDSHSPDVSHVGAYLLETVNGATLPQPRNVSGTLQVTGGVVILRADGTFKDSTTLVSTTDSGEVIAFMGLGVYARTDDTVEFVPFAGDHTYTMTFSKSAQTLTQQLTPAVIYVYKRSSVAID
jgi:hypothetical protein